MLSSFTVHRYTDQTILQNIKFAEYNARIAERKESLQKIQQVYRT